MCLALLLPPVLLFIVEIAEWCLLPAGCAWLLQSSGVYSVHLQNSAWHGLASQGTLVDRKMTWCSWPNNAQQNSSVQWPKAKFRLSFIFILSLLIWCFFIFTPVIYHLLCSSEFVTRTREAPVSSSTLCSCCTFLSTTFGHFPGCLQEWGCLVQPLVSSVTGCRLSSSLCYPDAYRLLSNCSPCLAAQPQQLKLLCFPAHRARLQPTSGRPPAAQVCFCLPLPPTQGLEGRQASNSCLLRSSGKVSSLSALLTGVSCDPQSGVS